MSTKDGLAHHSQYAQYPGDPVKGSVFDIAFNRRTSRDVRVRL